MSFRFHIFANAALGKGLSGGDRIFIELSRRLSMKYKVVIYVWHEGYEMCLTQNLKENSNLGFSILNVDRWCKMGFIVCYIARIIFAVKKAFEIKIPSTDQLVLYSASEFWMDSLPAFILKLRFPNTTWVAGWYQTAPNPLKGFTQGERTKTHKLAAFYYWLMQLPIKPLIHNFADIVVINNELEKKQFPKLDKKNKTLVMLGAVNIDEINTFKENYKAKNKKFDAVFQGRFHPQKGIVELIDIWKLVILKNPSAKLAIIGDGPLTSDVIKRIEDLNLSRNITLFGYVFDGPKKYEIFSKSKIVVHPAFFDSGGMAAAEAMAFGLPCVGFDLDSFKYYYPKGMIKVKIGDLIEFANTIVRLINNKREREKIGKEALEMISKKWDWNSRTNQLLKIL